ncbi:MAG: hypothetical protein SGJ20_00970 [Planctomycetota bacterium]|nr:hypothetical protein [Planctomycetota bacterium]
MVFENIEKLKQQYTDKLVIVDDSRPELARFRDATGVVRTVNMNGRALVEFDQYANIGWYDIELDFLKVVDQPQPKREKPEAKAPAAKAAKPAAKAKDAGTAPAKPAAAGKAGRPSVAEIMAAARANKGAAASVAPAASSTEEADETASEIETPVAKAKPAAQAKVAKKGASGPLPTTTAEKIAWCREHDKA